VEIAQSVVRNKRTAAKSGHKIGKSTGAAALALWWPITRYRGRTIITAPAGHQIRNIIWPEIRRLYQGAAYPLGGHCSPDPSRGLELPGGGGIICVTTDEAEKLAGLSGPNQLFIVDEASGFDERLWAPIFGNMAGGGRLLALGNPTQTSGTFHEAFSTKRHMWSTFTVSSAETPNVVTGRAIIPGLAERGWVLDMLEEHAGVKLPASSSLEEILEALNKTGDDSPFLNVRVKGEFPAQGENSVFGLRIIDDAWKRWTATPPNAPLSFGVDPARFGDDESVIVGRRGNWLSPPEGHRNQNGPDLANKVVAAILAARRSAFEPCRVKVDVNGIGSSCFDHLAERADALKFEVLPVNSAESSDVPDKYKNLRTQMHFGFETWLKEGGTLPHDEKLHAELAAPKYSFDERGRYVVEKKDEIKKRLKRSPDRADAAQLAVYEPQGAPDYDDAFDKYLPRGAM